MSLPPPTQYGDVILWERPIQVVAGALLHRGDHVVDAGTNTGGLAIAFSRLVGWRGRVLAFECNPRMVEWAKQDFVANRAKNIELVPLALFRSSGQELQMSVDDSYYSSGSTVIHALPGRQTVAVRTTTIDDECERAGLRPRLIKIDVEGAEVPVLEGAARTIQRCWPAIILERFPGLPPERDPARFVEGLGYRVFDVNTLRPFSYQSTSRFESNLLALPPSRSGGLGQVLRRGLPQTVETSACSASVELAEPGRAVVSALGAKQLVLKVRVAVEVDGEAMISVSDRRGQQVCCFHATAGHIAEDSCSSLPMVCRSSERLTVSVSAVSPPAKLAITGVEVRSFRFR